MLRRTLRAALAPLAVWALATLTLSLGTDSYLSALWHTEREAAFARAETSATLALQAQQHRQATVRATFRLLNMRHNFVLEGAASAAAQVDDELRQIQRETAFGILGLGYADLDGRMIWYTDPEFIGYSFRHRQYYAELQADPRLEVVLGSVVLNPITQRWILPILRRTRDAAGQPDGFSLIIFDPTSLSNELAGIDAAPGRTLLLANLRDGRVTAASRNHLTHFEEAETSEHAGTPVIEAAQSMASGRLTYAAPTDGRTVFAAYRVNPATNSVAMAMLSETMEMRQFRQQALAVVTGVAAIILSGGILGFAWVQNSLARSRLRERADHDPLTRLCNRRHTEDRVAKLLRDRPGPSFACLLFDLDHFKQINDLHGHATGDRVLLDVADLLRAHVRSIDLICRWGGEEMLVVLNNCRRPEAMQRADELRLRIGALYESQDAQALRVTTSIGVACYPEDGASFSGLVEAADEALYRAKRAGRNRIRTATPELVQSA